MGNCSSTSNCNPCGPDFSAINQLATKAGAYARQANTYATNAENAWLEFNALYLGAFAVAPTVDNEGDPLQTGALYWNTGSNLLFAWNGTVWATATNFNEFTPFLATGTTFARNLVTRFADIHNVKDFGAVGDGIADDTAALQAAIDSWIPYQEFVTDGGLVFLPPGRYRITSSLDMTGKHGLHFIGSGVQSTEIFATGDFPVIKSFNVITEPWIDGQVRDMTIRGGGNTNPNAHGIHTIFTNGCLIDNVLIFSCKYGLNLNHSWQYQISNVDMHGGGVDRCDIGVFMGPTSLLTDINNAITAFNITVKNCITCGFRIINGQGSKFSECEAGATPIGFHIGEPPTGTTLCQWLHFSNCLADSNSQYGWRIAKGNASELSQMQFTGCWAGNSGDELVFISQAEDLIFANCIFIKSDNHALGIRNSNRITFTGCQTLRFNFSNTAKEAIYLLNSNRISYTGTVNPEYVFANSDVLESGTSSINFLNIVNSNGGTLISQDSRLVSNETDIYSGGAHLLELVAKNGANSTTLNLINGTPKSWSLSARTNDNFSISDGANQRIVIDGTTGNVGIGTTAPNASSILHLESTTKAFLPPRMTTAERDLIASPIGGMVIYNTTTNLLNFHNGTSWGPV
jgi:hypothetical protein